MKELNGVKIIGIDHGYGNIKSSCTVTPTGLFEYETEPVFSGNILEYNGTYYRAGITPANVHIAARFLSIACQGDGLYSQ